MFCISATQATAIIALLATSVRGHMILGSPVPFDFADPTTQQSPLSADGSDFPCKFPAGFEPEQHTKNAPMAPGSSNELSFIGGATHGGGSCQVSLTTDTVPTKDSKWEVIHSIEGGCPADAEGNLSDDAQDTGSSKFSYEIPSDMASGKYTLAWTWFNKIGNREMYMNCAPIEVGSGSAKRQVTKINKKRQSSRPDMMVANIGNGCTTSEGTDVEFLAAGDSLELGSGASLGAPVGDCGSAGSSSSSSSSSSSDSSDGDSDDDADSTAPSSPGSFAETSSSSTDGEDDVADSTSSSNDGEDESSGSNVVEPVTDSTTTAPAVASASSSSSGASSAGGSCSEEGIWVCAPDGSSFTRCASGVMSPPMPMANGLKCKPGQSQNLEMATEAKRSVRFGA